MNRLRKGDEVVVISGSNKGERGVIEKVLYSAPLMADKVVITGVNQRTKHSRGNPQKNDPGGRIQKEMPIHVSNVALYNEHTKGAGRVRSELSDGKRQRVFIAGGKPV